MASANNIDNLRVKELRAELNKRGLDKSGVKATLVARLKQAFEDDDAAAIMDPVSANEEVKRQKELSETQTVLVEILQYVRSIDERLKRLETRNVTCDASTSTSFTTVSASSSTPTSTTEGEIIGDPKIEVCIPTSNPFGVLAVDETEDSTSSASSTSSPTAPSYNEQLEEYRQRHRHRPSIHAAPFNNNQIEDINAAAAPPLSNQLNDYRQRHRRVQNKHDVVVVGDSMIRHVDEARLSRQKKVKCVCLPGAKVGDILTSSPCESLKPGGLLVIHVGTNNLAEKASDVCRQLTDLCNSVTAEGFDVTVSSIIHRRHESKDERVRVDNINKLLESAANLNSFNMMFNDAIKDIHLGRDGVHLNRGGQRIIAENLKRCINPSSRGNGGVSSSKTYAEVARMHEEATGKEGRNRHNQHQAEVQPQLSNVSSPRHHQDFHRGVPKTRIKTDMTDWLRYLGQVRLLTN